MCVKFSLGDLNPGPCPPHSTSTYTCEVTIAQKMCGVNNVTIDVIMNLKLFIRLCLNIKCIMFYFIAQNLRKLGIILYGTYLLLNLPNIHYI